MEAARHGIMVLTGGPGTGKTTTINAMIHFFESEGMDIFSPHRQGERQNG